MIRSPLVPLLAAFSFLAANTARAADPERPNLIVIFADDLGYGELGCYGHPDFQTPSLDRMAAEGARLTNFYVPMPYCAPSRASLLTGRYPFRHGLTKNPTPDAKPESDRLGLDLSELLVSEILRDAGYATACVGKWHLGHQPEFLPRRRGFDEYFGIPYSNDMRPVNLLDGEQVVEAPAVQATLTKRYTERSIQFIKQNRERPFFLYLPHAMPHKPLAVSEPFEGKSGANLYGDAIAELDWSVGRILETLRKDELDRKTLVIFTSDNGPWFGGDTGGLRGMKGKSWDGGVRVPMIARWPGKIPAGQVCDAVAGTIDFFPTALALAGIPLPTDRVIDGRNLLPLLSGEAEKIHDGYLIMTGEKIMAVRSGKWKLHLEAPSKWPDHILEDSKWVDPRAPDGISILAPSNQPGPDQYPGIRGSITPRDGMLFDLEADPSESRDVAGEHPEIVERLRKIAERLQR